MKEGSGDGGGDPNEVSPAHRQHLGRATVAAGASTVLKPPEKFQGGLCTHPTTWHSDVLREFVEQEAVEARKSSEWERKEKEALAAATTTTASDSC